MDFTIRSIAGVSLVCLLSAVMASCTVQNSPSGGSGSSEGTDKGDTTITTNDTIAIAWSGSTVNIEGAHEGVSVTNEGGYVTVTSTVEESITYLLSGNGTGQLTIYGVYRHQLMLDGLTLSCSDGPAINNQCHKKCYVVLQGANSLSDGSSYATSSEDRKAAFFSEGQLIFSGSGSLVINGNYKHALASDDYIRFAESTGALTLKAAADGIHTNDGIYFDGGTFVIEAGADGVQCDTATIVVNDGSITVTAATDKGIVAFDSIIVNGGTIHITSDYKCIKTKSALVVNGGDIQVVCKGEASSGGGPGGGGPHWAPGGGPGGGGESSSENDSPEGIEAKGAITINGGKVYSQSADDAINSGGDLTINGGQVCAYSTGNDGIDANGNCYFNGGVVYAIGARSPEVAIDANSEQQKKLYINGGTIVAIGGLESGASLTQACYQAGSWSANTWYALTVGSEVFAFLTPESGGSGLIVSGATQPTLKKGVSADGTAIFNGMGYYPASASGGSSVSLSSYSGGGKW